MPLSFWLTRVSHGLEEDIRNLVEKIPTVEVTQTGNGCLVVVTDNDKPDQDQQALDSIRSIPGVKEITYVMTAGEDALGTTRTNE